MSAPVLIEPLSNGNFRYNGSDFCAVHNHKVYSRAAITDLVALLEYTGPAPVYTKTGKLAARQPAAHADQTAEYYTAQCIHYGLEPFKTKERAKRCLLDAISSAPKRNLKVPAAILALEKSMKADWTKANKEAIKERAKEEKTVEKAKLAEAKKRGELEKQSIKPSQKEAIKKTAQEKADKTPQASSSKAVASTSKKPVPPAKHAPAKKDGASAAAPKAEVKSAVKKESMKKEPVKQEPIKKQSIKKEAIKREAVEKQPVVKKETTTGSTSNVAAGKKRKIEEEAEEEKKPKIVKKAKVAISKTSINKCGRWAASVPHVEEQWSDSGGSYALYLAPAHSGKHLWVRFDFGIIQGYMRSTTQMSDVHSTNKISFHWRGQEEDGPITFDEENICTMEFSSDNSLTGIIDGDLFDNTSFTATREQNTVVSYQVGLQFRKEFRSMTESRYNVEASSRWGGYGGEARSERAAKSDSDAGAAGSEEEYASEDDQEAYYASYGF